MTFNVLLFLVQLKAGMIAGKRDNIKSIQFLRGIAALMVLLNHGHDIAAIPAESFLKQQLEYGSMGVNVFFIISGFILPLSMFINNYTISDFKQFFLKRIVRIEPPYIASIVLVLLLGYFTTFSSKYTGTGFHVSWANVLGHIGYVNAFTGAPWLNRAYWTLAVEFEFYILLALLYPLITHANKYVLTVSYLMLLATSFIPVSNAHILQYLPFFMMGILLFQYKTQMISLRHFAILLVITSLVCYQEWGAILLGLSLVVLVCIQYLKKVPQAFMLLGTISYSLYLTHGVLLTRFMSLAGKVLPGCNSWLLFSISVALCLIFAYVFYQIVEKAFINLSKKIRYDIAVKPGKTAIASDH